MGKRNWNMLRNDLVALMEDLNKMETMQEKEEFIDWIDACRQYMFAAGKQIYESQELKNDGSLRFMVEGLNKKRTETHDNAINRTIILNKRLMEMSGLGRYLLDLNIGDGENYLNDAKSAKDINSEQRQELAEFFWEVCSVVVGLDKKGSKEFEDIAKDVQIKKEKNKYYDKSKKIKEIPKNIDSEMKKYGVRNFGDPNRKDKTAKGADDFYEEIR